MSAGAQFKNSRRAHCFFTTQFLMKISENPNFKIPKISKTL